MITVPLFVFMQVSVSLCSCFPRHDINYTLLSTIALEFRESLGGEEAIMKHTHEMAVKGGALVAELLGTSVMENPEGTLTASMVNVELPLKESKYSDGETERLFIEKIIYEHNCMAPAFKHNGKWWVRLSGQVYNDLDDFKYGAKVIQQICNELQK